jgi:hypothetical protein
LRIRLFLKSASRSARSKATYRHEGEGEGEVPRRYGGSKSVEKRKSKGSGLLLVKELGCFLRLPLPFELLAPLLGYIPSGVGQG